VVGFRYWHQGAEFELPASVLPGPAQPRVLPRHLNILVIAAEPDVRAIAVGDLDGLVFENRKCNGSTNAGTRLL
jgi:hypothetical protein